MNTHTQPNVLKNVTFLNSLEQSVIDTLSAKAVIVNFASGEVILREGDASDAAWVVVEGKVQIYKERPDGQHLFLHTVQAGELFGEQALITGNKRNACARAQTPVVALRLPELEFLAAISTQTGMREKFALLGTKQLYENIARESTLLKFMSLDGGPSQSGRERVLTSGQVLFREGDDAHHVYVILSGKAAVYQHKDTAEILVTYLTAGQTIGELALIRNAPRAATVIAEGTLRLYEIDASYFRELTESSKPLRDHLQVLESVYILPRRGFVTQYTGQYLGHDAFNTLYDLRDGTRLIASIVVGETLCNLERVLTKQEQAQALTLNVVRYEDVARNIQRELRLDEAGQIYGLTVFGTWSELPDLYAMAMDGSAIDAIQIELFCRTGFIGAPTETVFSRTNGEIVCRCINIKSQTVRDAIVQGADSLQSLQKSTRCGTVCGACIPELKQMLGGPGSVAARIKETIEVCEGIQTFRLEPLNVQTQESLPGQHVVLEGHVDGHWVRRAYTLSAPVRDGFYEVTIKREGQGLFSRWLFEKNRENILLKVSPPQGEYYWQAGQNSVTCLVAGIGVTPALAICRSIVQQNLSNKLHIDYSARAALDFAYANELTEVAQQYPNISLKLRITSVEPRLDLAELERLEATSPGADYYLCGPQSYLDGVSELLTRMGVPPERIRSEVFVQIGGAPAVATPKTAISKPKRKRKPSDELDFSLFFVGPKELLTPSQPHGLLRWLATFDRRYSLNWTFAGKKIAPLSAFIDWVELKLGGVDPHVPSDHLALAKSAVFGRIPASHATYTEINRRLGANREQGRHALKQGKPLALNTPDGMTYSVSFRTITYPQLEWLEPRIDTGWVRSSNKPLSCVYMSRSPTVMHAVLCGKNFDRGPISNHYWQKFVGRPNLSPHGDKKAGGSLIGQYHNNKSWEMDRDLAMRLVGASVLAERSGHIAQVIEDVFENEIRVFNERHPGQVFDSGVFMGEIVLRVVLFTTFPGLDEQLLRRLGAKYLQLVNASFPAFFALRANPKGQDSFKDEILKNVPQIRAVVSEIATAIRTAYTRGEFSQDQIDSPMIHYTIFGSDGQVPDDSELVSIFGTFLIGAHETTAHLLTWAVYELGRSPAVYKAVQKEIDDFKAAHRGRDMTPDDYDERPITLALLLELNRLHPGIHLLPRSALQAGTIPSDPMTGIGGFDYPADALFFVSILELHLDPDTYFKPREFQIERFLKNIKPGMSLNEQGAQVRQNAIDLERQFRLVTFGAGPGNCPGRHFNMIEFFLVIDNLMRRYDFILTDPDRVPDIDEKGSIVVKPTGSIAVELCSR